MGKMEKVQIRKDKTGKDRGKKEKGQSRFTLRTLSLLLILLMDVPLLLLMPIPTAISSHFVNKAFLSSETMLWIYFFYAALAWSVFLASLWEERRMALAKHVLGLLIQVVLLLLPVVELFYVSVFPGYFCKKIPKLFLTWDKTYWVMVSFFLLALLWAAILRLVVVGCQKTDRKEKG